jgi:periplasmic protein TonB
LNVLKPLPNPNDISRAGVNGVDVPRCIACPVPSYSERGKAAKVQGRVVLSVVISEDGRAETIAVVKRLGFGLTQQAIEAVSEWRFRPATKEGQPVPVFVPIEVTMRIN